MKINAWAATAVRSQLSPHTYITEGPGCDQVLIAISHCGICYSDVHLIQNDWGSSQYPLVPGHEIVGEVLETGSAVTHLKKGMRVGIGWQRHACLTCDLCVTGYDNLCATGTGTCSGGNHGGFADHVVIDAQYAFPIPDGLSSAGVAPMMCGGVTVYNPMSRYGVRHDMRVGVVGVGGLGHLAIKFAGAFGCEVTAISHSPGKREDAHVLGAHHFVTTEADGSLDLTNALDFILVTAHADLEWNSFMRALRPNGNLCFVGVPPGDINVGVTHMTGGQKKITGGSIGSRGQVREMLEFAARHDLEAVTERYAMSDVNAAVNHLKEGKARFRVVLENP